MSEQITADDVLRTAADEIDRLQSRVAELERERDALRAQLLEHAEVRCPVCGTVWWKKIIELTRGFDRTEFLSTIRQRGAKR